MAKRTWTREEEEYLIENYANTPKRQLAEYIGTTARSVVCEATGMGLRKSKECISRMARENMSEAFKKQAGSRWKKGMECPYKPKSPVGEITLRVRNNWRSLWIKLPSGEWQKLTRYVWEQANGKIPNGYVVVLIDGNFMNCDLSNLKMISRHDNIARNSVNRLSKEMKDLIRVKASFQRKLNKIIKNHGKTKD